MNAIRRGWEQLHVSPCKKLSPRAEILMAGLSRDELLIIGGKEENEFRGDAYILDIPRMKLQTVIRNSKTRIKFSVISN